MYGGLKKPTGYAGGIQECLPTTCMMPRTPRNFNRQVCTFFLYSRGLRTIVFLRFQQHPLGKISTLTFAPLGLQIAQDNYYYTRYLVQYNTDLSKKWSGDIGYNFGSFYNGTRNTINAAARFAPIPHAALALEYEHNTIKDVGVDESNLSTNLYSANLRLALNPRLQLSTFYQYNSLMSKDVGMYE